MSPEQVTAIAAVIVALAALFISVWQAAIARGHNRLSVRPVLAFVWHDNANRIGLYLRNVGTGPACLHTLRLSLVEKVGKEEQLLTAFDACSKLELSHVGTCYIHDDVNKNEWIESMAEWTVLTFKMNWEQVAEREKNIRAIQRLKFEISYSSIYGERITTEYRIQSASFPIG